jgi:GNAT superfamily N-acetyltransferase
MRFAIREAELADMEDLQGVFRRASLSNENDRDQLLEHPEWLVLSDTGVREGRVRVAVDGSGIVLGFATYLFGDAVLTGDAVAELEDLFVDPRWRRRRVAEALVLDISTQVSKRGFKMLEVTANPHAMAFYEHMGFLATHHVDTEFYPAPRMRRPTTE